MDETENSKMTALNLNILIIIQNVNNLNMKTKRLLEHNHIYVCPLKIYFIDKLQPG